MTMFPPDLTNMCCDCMQPNCPYCGQGRELPLYLLDYIDLKYPKTMKLSKALKEKKKLAAEIAQIKNQIQSKNSFVKGSKVNEKFNVVDLNSKLQQKIQEMVNLRIVINEANKEIQPLIYLLAEYKGLISYYSSLNVTEGPVESYRSESMIEYEVQIDEIEKIKLVEEFQNKADHLQDQIDSYNYSIDIAWGEQYPEEDNNPQKKSDSVE